MSPFRNGKQGLPAKSPLYTKKTEQGVRNVTAFRGEATKNASPCDSLKQTPPLKRSGGTFDERTFTGVPYLVKALELCGALRFRRKVRLLRSVRTSPWRWGAQLPQCQNLQGIDILSGFSILSQHRTAPWHWGLPQCRASAECRSAQIIKPLCGIGGKPQRMDFTATSGSVGAVGPLNRNICFILLYHKYKPPSIGGLYKILV